MQMEAWLYVFHTVSNTLYFDSITVSFCNSPYVYAYFACLLTVSMFYT